MKILPLFYLLLITMLSGCRIVVVVPEGGMVTTESGAYTCKAESNCEIPVVDFFFKEKFVAIPDYRRTFFHWRKASMHLCGERINSCSLTTEGLGGQPAWESLLRSDKKFYLRPVFLEEKEFDIEPASKCFNPTLYQKGTRSTSETSTSVVGLVRYNIDRKIERIVDGVSTFGKRSATKISTEGSTTTYMYIPAIDPFFEEQTNSVSSESYQVVEFDSKTVTQIRDVHRSKTTKGDLSFLFAGRTYTKELTEPGFTLRFNVAAGDNYYSIYRRFVHSEAWDVNGTGYAINEYEESIDNEVVYRGMETITVPAGTFRACRFEQHSIEMAEASDVIPLGADIVIEWYGFGNGVLIKSIRSGPDNYKSTKLLSASINGIPVNGI